MAIKRVAFKDGACFTSWCTNPGCADFRDDNEALLQGVFCANVDGFPRSSIMEEFPDASKHLCRCAKSVMHCCTKGDAAAFDMFFDELDGGGAIPGPGIVPCLCRSTAWRCVTAPSSFARASGSDSARQKTAYCARAHTAPEAEVQRRQRQARLHSASQADGA